MKKKIVHKDNSISSRPIIAAIGIIYAGSILHGILYYAVIIYLGLLFPISGRLLQIK
jgi:hypothetical protein